VAQEYKLTSFKTTDFKDQNNNYWCDGAFEGISEPVKIVTPAPPKWIVGETYYGTISVEVSKAGKAYNRFRRISRPEPVVTAPESNKWSGRDDKAIQAQWSIGQAVQVELAVSGDHFDDARVETQAKRFMAMIERVKTGASIVTPEPLPSMPAGVDPVSGILDDEPINLDDIPF
jgi:hypothetical protein